MPPGSRLQVVVVDDPAIAEQIEQLSGTWEAMAGATIDVQRRSHDELLAAQSLEADAVIAPPHLVGELSLREWIARVPELSQEQLQEDWLCYFEMLRDQEASWAGDTVGVPFGSPVFVLYYREDLLGAIGSDPPRRWAEYQAVAKKLAEKQLTAYPTLEPVAPGWAALTFLARATPYASHHENYSVLFNIETMEPLIDGPPFVRALEEMIATPGTWPAASPEMPDRASLTPDEVRRLFWSGATAMAITWPSGATELDIPSLADTNEQSAKVATSLRVGIAPMPGTARVYDIGKGAWERRASDRSGHVPLLSVAGRMGFLSADTEWPEPAFELLLWLSGEQWGTQVAAASPATTMFRESQLARPGPWTERPMGAAPRLDYLDVVRTTYSGRQCVFAFRIPGRDKYLKALDTSVCQALAGERTAEAALAEAAQRWREITAQLGPDAQREAYGKSLGIW